MEPGVVLAARFRLVSLLGQGGMGSVWRAEHLGLRAPIAIKLIDPDILDNQEALTRFHREAQAAAALRSPHVVQILDYGVDPETRVPYIAMELLEGEDLRQRLNRVGRLSASETASLVTQVARALARAHEAGIVHRDLKPENVSIVRNEDEEIAKVLDFGISKISELSLTSGAATRTGSVMGTPYYMSPEQIVGSKQTDYRTDLWALAVISYECLLGVRPFNEETIGGLAVQICTQEPPRPSAHGPVPAGFDLWFARALAREAGHRFQSARELAEGLRAVCGAREVSGNVPVTLVGAPPVLHAQSTDPLSRTAPEDTYIPLQRTSPWLFVGLGILVLTAGLMVLTFSRRNSNAVPESAQPTPSVTEVADAAPSGAASADAPTVLPVPPSEKAPKVRPNAAAALRPRAAVPVESAPAPRSEPLRNLPLPLPPPPAKTSPPPKKEVYF